MAAAVSPGRGRCVCKGVGIGCREGDVVVCAPMGDAACRDRYGCLDSSSSFSTETLGVPLLQV